MTSSIDQQFIEYIVKSLVNNADAVEVKRTIDEKGVLLELTVDPDDLGRVIGKRGATAQSLRTLLRALGTKNDARYNLKIIDNGEGPRSQPRQDDERPSQEETVTTPKSRTDDILDELDEDREKTADKEDSDVIAKTRKELDDLDDLDI
jgi:uncharacterized protein